MTKFNYGRKWPEFTSKATGGLNFNGSIRRRSATVGLGTGGTSFPSSRASKPSRWLELGWPETSPVTFENLSSFGGFGLYLSGDFSFHT